MREHTTMSWVRLNGYGVLVALLEIFISVFYFIDPEGTRLLTVANAGIGLSGVLLLSAYFLRRVDVEVLASVMLIVVNLLDFYAEYRSSVPPIVEARDAVIQMIIVIAVYLRVTALLEGGTYVIPQWRLGRADRDHL